MITKSKLIEAGKLIFSVSVLFLIQMIFNGLLIAEGDYSLAFPPAIIVALIGLAGTGVGFVAQSKALNAPKTQCEQDCTNVCKASHGALFSGRQKCIKQCKADCAVVVPPPVPPTSGAINWYYVIGGILVFLALIIYMFKPKK